MAFPRTNSRQWRTIRIAGAMACAVVLVLYFLALRHKDRKTSTAATRQRATSTTGTEKPDSGGNAASVIGAALRNLHDNSDRTTTRRQLDELRQALQSLPPRIASAGIRDVLDSKIDIVTRLQFKVGSDGFLTSSPSLRVFLLDYLAQIDPAEAASYARHILTTMESPDEWAVALRNYAKSAPDSDGRSFLEDKLQTMLAHEPWVREPSDGFLEAFDVAVYLGGTNLIPTLAKLVQMQDNQATAHAAYLTLDRLTIADATASLTFFQANPKMMQGREVTRANYFARADVREPAQCQLLEEYLLNPALVAAELEKFSGLYPNANFMISHNLLTRVITPDGDWLAARDAEALRVAQQWIKDPRFDRVKHKMEAIRERLEKFVQQSNQPP